MTRKPGPDFSCEGLTARSLPELSMSMRGCYDRNVRGSKALLPLLLLGASFTGCATSETERSLAAYTNPVLDSDFPDPAVLKAPDGFYYAYATQGERDGRMLNVQVARSSNLVDWQPLGTRCR